MGFLTTPLYLLGPPLLFVVSLPLAIFAAFTTGLAITLLAARLSVVYFELGVALIHAYIFPEPAKPIVPRAPPPAPSPPRFRRTSSSHDVPPAARLYPKSGSSASLVDVNRMAGARDFEGVGGWRFYEDEEEEAVWMGMNKRLELPLALPPGRRHQRRHTGEERQRLNWSPGTLRMSPLQSRMRTPQRTPQRSAGLDDEAAEDYFTPQPVLRPLSTASEPLSMSVQNSKWASIVSANGSSSPVSSASPGSQMAGNE